MTESIFKFLIKPFKRVWKLHPTLDLDNIFACYKNGILSITLNKHSDTDAVQRKKIPVVSYNDGLA